MWLLLQALRNAGFHLVIVTSRQLVIADQTRAWVARHFPGRFEPDDILFGNHWGRSGDKTSKLALCRSIGAEAIIDDAVSYSCECAANGIPAVLFGNYAWNQSDEPLPSGVTRLTGWVDVVKYFC
jgi:hypothetical protein